MLCTLHELSTEYFFAVIVDDVINFVSCTYHLIMCCINNCDKIVVEYVLVLLLDLHLKALYVCKTSLSTVQQS